MIRRIYRYPLHAGPGSQILQIPFGAEHLTVQVQQGTPVLWSLVDVTEKSIPVYVDVFPIGEHVQNINRTYIATYQLEGGDLIYHVFIRI